MASRHTLRPASLADVEPVARLLREVAFKPRSEAGWRWLFQDNPAVRRQHSAPEMGWVLEGAGGEIDGYLGNVHLDYVLDGAPLSAATDNSYYVRPAARGDAARLMSAFFRQPGVELFLNTTANEASAPVYVLFKALPPEDASFSEGLLWVADDRIAIADALAKKGVAKALAHVLGFGLAPLSRTIRSVAGFAKPPRAAAADVEKLLPGDIDARFDALWARIAQAPGLRVRRDAAALRWYLADPDVPGNPTVFASADAEGLTGYAAVAQHCPPGTVVTQVRILDFVLRPGAEHAAPALLARVIAHAREVKAGLVYCPPCGAQISGPLKRLRPYVLRHTRTSHLLRAARGRTTADLARAGVWHATALDGDTPFCIEYVAAGSAG